MAYGGDCPDAAERAAAEELAAVETKISGSVISALKSADSAGSARSLGKTLINAGWLLYRIYQAGVRAGKHH